MKTVLVENQLRKKLRRVWKGMKERCQIETHKSYAFYGGRGIYVSKEWQEFEPFHKWAMSHGYEPGKTIDRVDNDGPYAPWNCRFVSRKRQMNNMSRNVWVKAFGERKTLAQWCEDPRCIVDHHTVSRRIAAGLSAEDAMTLPAGVALKGRKQVATTSRLVSAFGETQTLAQWSRDDRCVVDYTALLSRLDAGWTPEEALTRPSGDKMGRQRKAGSLTAFGETKTYAAWTEDPRCTVGESCLRMRIGTYGWQPEAAITTPPIVGRRKTSEIPKTLARTA